MKFLTWYVLFGTSVLLLLPPVTEHAFCVMWKVVLWVLA